jgi:hypothetical protein
VADDEDKARAPQPAGPTVAAASPAPPAKTPDAAPPLDLKALEQRLRDTKAIGMFTKLSLKNKVDDLLDEFEDYYAGKPKYTVKALRQPYDLLLMRAAATRDPGPFLRRTPRAGLPRARLSPSSFRTAARSTTRHRGVLPGACAPGCRSMCRP